MNKNLENFLLNERNVRVFLKHSEGEEETLIVQSVM